ncbi:MAG TPA: RluA family pseudouridine synthase [Thermotogota bacterium]|nr:RluA family pseudouridine synthase [Thermotogota bacterium]HRW92535.1 RluA family pseudouridine synthase [Thermotogota bacterium]
MPFEEILEYRVGAEESGIRLDRFVNAHTPDWVSRSLVQKAIREGHVWVDGSGKKPSFLVRSGQVVALEVPAPRVTQILPQNILLHVLYEDGDILVVNKPPGMLVHPVPHQVEGTLVNALLFHCKGLARVGGEERPGIVHRLDKDTSGVLVVSKNDAAHQHLSKQFHDRLNQKQYLALLSGALEKDQGKIDYPLGRNPHHRLKMMVDYSGKEALTFFEVLRRFSAGATLVRLTIKTGRTHQIRVHCKNIGHPVLGDPIYGNSQPDMQLAEKIHVALNRQMLHSFHLGITHPRTGKWMDFYAPLFDDFKEVLRALALHSA